MPVLGMLRVKNEQRWLPRALASILPVCDHIYILDDHSTDLTPEIIKSTPKCTLYHSQFDEGVDEARDRTWLLLEMGRAANICIDPVSPVWVLSIDGDEELVEADREILTQPQSTFVNSYCAQILYLWDNENQIRVDRHYAMCLRPSFFRFTSPHMEFRNHSGPLHTTGVPISAGYTRRRHFPAPFRLLHYGYMDAADRQKKYDFYMALDPAQKEFYSRECFGPAQLTPLSEVLV